MNEIHELWTNEYFVDLIERQIKYQISMYFHVHHDRKPTAEEYKEYFEMWKAQAECNVTDYDLGIFE